MYESPIKIIESAIDSFSKSLVKEKEDAIILEVKRSLGVDVDSGELLKALQYDRFQYDKGYADGKRDAEDSLVRCKDCKISFANPFLVDEPQLVCRKWANPHIVNPDDFCSYGERREG